MRREPDAVPDTFSRQLDKDRRPAGRRYFANRLLPGKIDGVDISLRITSRALDAFSKRPVFGQWRRHKEDFGTRRHNASGNRAEAQPCGQEKMP